MFLKMGRIIKYDTVLKADGESGIRTCAVSGSLLDNSLATQNAREELCELHMLMHYVTYVKCSKMKNTFCIAVFIFYSIRDVLRRNSKDNMRTTSM